jgi:hypothetical protein
VVLFADTYILPKKKNQYFTDKKSPFVWQACLLDTPSRKSHFITETNYIGFQNLFSASIEAVSLDVVRLFSLLNIRTFGFRIFHGFAVFSTGRWNLSGSTTGKGSKISLQEG